MADGFTLADDVRRKPRTPIAAAGGGAPLTIGLINNMPDAAVAATEAQFRALLDRAAGGRPIILKLFSLPGVPRSEAARTAMATRYLSTNLLSVNPVDALIVTGAEPLAAELRDEPFWAQMAALTDWAERHTVSTVFSCLAAHAAVLHLDGVRRQPLVAKCSGVFAMQASEHPLTRGHAGPLLTPHSRWNALNETHLARRGYTLLTRSDEIGADAFIRDRDSLFLFLQGHPEYEAYTLMLEYRRDVRRFLIGERAQHPGLPSGYFTPDVAHALRNLAEETALKPQLSALSECASILRTAAPIARWAPATTQLYRNWLDLVAERVGA